MSHCSYFDRKGATLTTVIKRSNERPFTPEKNGNIPLDAGHLKAILASLEDASAEEIVLIDIRERSILADFMVIASGRSQRHVAAVAGHLLHQLKQIGCGNVRVEGQASGDWILIDAGDIIMHLFHPEVRAFYNLEKMWIEPGLSEDVSKVQGR